MAVQHRAYPRYGLVDLYAAFLDNPTGVLDRSCTAQMKPITFALDGFGSYVAEVSKHRSREGKMRQDGPSHAGVVAMSAMGRSQT